MKLLIAFTLLSLSVYGFENKNKIYSIDFPEEWTIDEQTSHQIEWVTARAPADKKNDPYLENIQITYNLKKSKTTLHQYLPEMLRFMREKYVNADIQQIGSVTLDGKEAKWVLFKSQGSGESGKKVPLKAMHYLIVNDGHLMIILFVAPSDRFEDLKPTFEKSVNSLKFNN